MTERLITTLAIACAAFGGTACEEEPARATLVTDPVLEEQRADLEAPLGPEDLELDGVTAPMALDELERVQPAVAVMAIDVDCDETAVFFETDAAALGPEDERKLDSLAACLTGTPEQEVVRVSGHTDPRASEAYNEELARERAQAVAAYLREQGVADDAFEIRARGERGAIEGVPILWPAQRNALVDPGEPTGS